MDNGTTYQADVMAEPSRLGTKPSIAREKAAIETMVGYIEANQAELTVALERLTERLRPILTQKPMEDYPEAVEQDLGNSPLYYLLTDINRRTNTATTIVRALTSDLEI